eukprot:404411_1
MNTLTNKLQNENLSKQQIMKELEEQKQLVSNMKQDINILQLTLEDTQKEVKVKTAQYEKLMTELQDTRETLEDTEWKLKEELKEYKKLSTELKEMTEMAEQTTIELEGALQNVQVLETEVSDLNVNKTELNDKYRKHKRRVWAAFVVYTALIAGAAAWVYMMMEEEAELHVKKLEIKKDRMQRVFELKQEKVEEQLKEKEKEIEALQKKVTDANNRGLWSYIFG